MPYWSDFPALNTNQANTKQSQREMSVGRGSVALTETASGMVISSLPCSLNTSLSLTDCISLCLKCSPPGCYFQHFIAFSAGTQLCTNTCCGQFKASWCVETDSNSGALCSFPFRQEINKRPADPMMTCCYTRTGAHT